MPGPIELKRTLSLTLITFYGLGTILGAGIYVLIGKVAGAAGLYAPVAFLVAALLAAFTALSYAELAARFPRSAGEAVYVHEGLRWRGFPAVVGGSIVLTGTVSAATITTGFVGYVHVFVAIPDWLAMTLLVVTLGGLAVWGISESVIVASILTLAEIAGLILIVWVARDGLATLPERLPELIPPLEVPVWRGILLAAFLAFFAYIGFEDMVNVAEEVKEPVRNLPRAILLAMGITTLLYLSVALVAVLALTPQELTRSEAPLALIYERTTASPPTLISLISIFAIVNGALIQIIMAARMLYGLSRQGWLHAVFARVHPVTRTPVIATTVVSVLVLSLAFWFPVVTLAKATGFVILLVFILINLSLIRIKRRAPSSPGVRVYPLWIPVVGFVSSVLFLLYQVWWLVRA